MSGIRAILEGFISSRRGNVATLAALMFPMILLMMGGAMDYIQAGRRQEALQGISDAASLSALTPQMMSQTDATAISTVQTQFAGQMSTVTGVGTLTYVAYPGSCTANCYTVNVTDTSSGATLLRTSVVNFYTTSSNVFSKILGFSSSKIGGGSTAKNNLAPATNFYMLIDTSGSMGIAGNPADIATLSTYTSAQGGCAFSCHESDPSADTDDALYNPASVPCTSNSTTYGFTTAGFNAVGTHSGTAYGAEDNFALARCLGLTLRIDLVNDAVTSLLSTAPATAVKNNTTYGVALYTFDYTPAATSSLHVLWPTAETYLSNPTQFQLDMENFSSTNGSVKAAGTIQQLEIYKNNCVTSSNCNSDEDTWTDDALTMINTLMPNPGQGTGAVGDSPKEVVFLITDAVEDYVYGGSRNYGPMNTNIPSGTDFCTTIKNRGIRIAVLYLTYNALDAGGTGSWYDSYVAPIQSKIQPAAQNCASSGLYTEVNSGGDVTAALNNLFQQAVETAYLSH